MAGATNEGATTEVGLVLQGGGALGAYEWGAIEALFDVMDGLQKQGRDIVLQAVTGVSIGAINAACVVGSADRKDARDRLAALWNDFMIGLPFAPSELNKAAALCWVPNFYIFSPGLTCLYDTRALLKTLSKHVDFSALNSSPTAFVVTSTDVQNGRLRPFANKSLPDIIPITIGPEHILASGSLPPHFPWTDVFDGGETRHFWDGGIVDNTPLGYAFDAFSPNDVDRALVVMNLFPQTSRLPDSLAHVNDRVDQLRFGNRLLQDSANARRISGLVETIAELKQFIDSLSTPLPANLKTLVDDALKFKFVRTIEVTLGPKKSFADEYGFRDFSAGGIKRRHDEGRDHALDILQSRL